MDLNLELKAFIEAMKKNGCPMWMFERDEDGNFEDMGMAYAWYAWQEKAKAQAVPETHIVVPKQPTPKMIDATWDFDDEILEMSSNTRNEFIWKKMVKASESGAEG